MSGGFGDLGLAESPWAAPGPELAEISASAAMRPSTVDVPAVRAGDVVRDANGNLVGAIDSIDEEVAFYITTVEGGFFGRSEIGNSVVRVQTRTGRSEVEIRDRVKRALSRMVTRGDIENVVVTPSFATHNGLAWATYSVTYQKTGIVRR